MWEFWGIRHIPSSDVCSAWRRQVWVLGTELGSAVGTTSVLNCFTNSLAPHPTPLLPVLDCKRLVYVCVTLKVEPAALCVVNKYSFTELHPQTLVLGTQISRLVSQLLVSDNLSFSFSPSLSPPPFLPSLIYPTLVPKLPMLAEANLHLLIPPACTSQALTLQVIQLHPWIPTLVT